MVRAAADHDVRALLDAAAVEPCDPPWPTYVHAGHFFFAMRPSLLGFFAVAFCFFAVAFFAVCARRPHTEPSSGASVIGISHRLIYGPRTEARRSEIVRGWPVAFGFFCREPPTFVRPPPSVCASFGAQSLHHRTFPSAGSPKLDLFSWQPSHILLLLARSTTPACAFAQPKHHRTFPSDGSPKLDLFSWQPSHFLLAKSTAPPCPFAQPEHHRFFPSDGSPKPATIRPQSSHFLLRTFTAPTCAFAQPEHHRFFPSAGSPRLGACGDPSYHSL
jgi:hypothetical protein